MRSCIDISYEITLDFGQIIKSQLCQCRIMVTRHRCRRSTIPVVRSEPVIDDGPGDCLAATTTRIMPGAIQHDRKYGRLQRQPAMKTPRGGIRRGVMP
jgi:hypothetical protein